MAVSDVQDFRSFMQIVVLPSKAAQPTAIRLDGARTGGNRTVAGTFRHHGTLWKVHADTHYEPLEIAYKAALEGQDPFVEGRTSSGKCLALRADLRASQRSRPKYLYIYEV
jgi:hypothetical protein